MKSDFTKVRTDLVIQIQANTESLQLAMTIASQLVLLLY